MHMRVGERFSNVTGVSRAGDKADAATGICAGVISTTCAGDLTRWKENISGIMRPSGC